MSVFSKAPTTGELLVEAAGASSIRHKVEFKGIVLELQLREDRILVCREDDERPIAVLRFGGPNSGAIWLNDQLIAEYDKDSDGYFVVTVIEAGFKLPDSRRQEDPVQHLLGHLQPA